MSGKQWSPYQEAVFSHIRTEPSTSAIVEAVAGSGKTTTCVEGVNHLSDGETYTFLAFNKANATALVERGVDNAKTFHSLGLRALPRGSKVDSYKAYKLQDSFLTDEQKEIFGMPMRRLAALAKNVLVHDYESVASLEALVETYDIESEDSYTLCKLTVELLKRMARERQTIDFDDMLWHPVIHHSLFSKYDTVFVDEAQDTNNLQRHILDSIIGQRLIAVGDPHQAIYGFRGANHTAMDTLGERYGCETLPLHISYRCPLAVVREAQQYVRHIEAFEGAKAGMVMHLPMSIANLRKQNAILCRNTAPLIRTAYQLIAEHIQCFVAGRDIGKGLETWVKKFKLPLDASIVDLWTKVNQWADAEMAKPNANRSRIDDKVECLEALAEGCETVQDVLNSINEIFTDDGRGLALSTIHRAKGMEFDNVALIYPELLPSKYATTTEELQQERNLAYVAITRAQSNFTYLEGTVK